MGAYPYCIMPAGHLPPEGLVGLDDLPVECLEVGDLVVWVSTMAKAPELEVAALQLHDAVGRAAIEAGRTPLPVRFGDWVEDPEELTHRILAREELFRRALDAVDGSGEMGLRIREALQEAAEAPASSGEPPAEPPRAPVDQTPGRAYMEALSGRYAADERRAALRESVLAELNEAIGGLVRDERWIPLDDPPDLVSVAHLVGNADVDAWREGVARFRDGRPDLQLFEVGPWLPYSFAP